MTSAYAVDMRIHGNDITLSNIIIPKAQEKLAQTYIQNWQESHPTPTLKHRYPNRFGHQSAIIMGQDHITLQAALLEQGLAFLLPSGPKIEHMDALKQAERRAIKEKRNIWQYKPAPLKQNHITKENHHQFQIILGTIKEAAKRGNIIYLNFGDDWRQDFTIKLRSPATRQLQKTYPNLSDLSGKNVQIRGWLFLENGPMIETRNIDHLDFFKNTNNK